jgi:glycine cleavage system H protein
MAQESYPEDLKYFKEHDWVRVEGGEATFGITWWAQDALGDMVYASLPDVGTAVSAGQPYGELESVKSVAEI